MPNLPAAIPRPTTLAEREAIKDQRVTGKVRVAVEAMVWQGLSRKDAAQHAAMSEHGLYQALRRPPVRALYLGLLDVLRTSERARNIHALVEVRDQTDNQMARVGAVKALEQMEEQQLASVNRSAVPGLMIVVNAAPARENDAKPLIEHGLGHIEGVGTEPRDSE